MRLGLSLPSAALYRQRGQPPAPETAGLLARMSVPPSPARRTQIDTLVKTLLAAGLWTKLDALYLTAAHDAQAARLNLVPWTGTVTNLLPNGEMIGATTGAPGTMPTGWASVFMVGGITRQVVGVGTVNGMRYIDVRFSGTPASASGIGIPLSSTNACPGVVGSRMTVSLYLALIGGSLDGTTLTRVNYTEYNASNAVVAADYNVIPAQSITLTSALTRVSGTRVLTGATAAFVVPALEIGHGTGAIDLTLRIAAPQLVRMDVPGNFIPTSGVPASQVQTLARFDLSAVNSPVFSVDRGYSGNGTSSYLDTNADPSVDFSKATLSSASYGGWAGLNLTSGFSLGDANNRVSINPRTSGDQINVRINSPSGLTSTAGTAPTAVGLTVANRPSENLREGWKNGVLVVSDTQAPSSLPVDLALLRAGATCSANQVSAAFAGSSLTAAQHLALYSALRTYLMAVGAAS